jgi:manganese-dependent inorganic pyrophosphatase
MDKPIYVIGHKNPDADAICSAIGYAALRKAQGRTQFRPARCGNTNPRIDAILKHFNVPAPKFIGDVTPRVRDIMVSKVQKIKSNFTCAEALEVIDEYDIRCLPVVGDKEHLDGYVSVFKLGEYFTPQLKNHLEMRKVQSSVADIVRALKAKILNIFDAENFETLFVRVGAMDIRSFGKTYEKSPTSVPAEQSIVVVGDRWDIQEKSIQLGVRLLVISGGLEVDPDVIERAARKKVSLIVSPFDTATTSWIIRSATHVRFMMEKEMVSFRPDERLSHVRRRIAHVNAPLYFVTDEKDRLLGVFSKSDILRPIKTQIVLVDHNEITQAVNGASEVRILEIIDHHRLGNPPTDQPILFINDPVGSTSTIVGELYRRAGVDPEPAIAGVLMAGIISDTLHLKGPTSTDKDQDILGWLETFSPTSADQLSDLIFSAGSIILAEPPERVIGADYKHYDEGGLIFGISQVEELGFDNFWAKADAILKELDKQAKADGLMFAALLVTDINTQNSLLAVSNNPDVLNLISYPITHKKRIYDLPGVVSRKKQLIPYLCTALRVGA